MFFASLVVEHEPPKWESLPASVESWIQDAGGFAAAGLAVWLLLYLLGRTPAAAGEKRPAWERTLFLLALTGALLAYVAAGGFRLLAAHQQQVTETSTVAGQTPTDYAGLMNRCLTYGGLCALAAAGLPFLLDLRRLRARRIWALAKVSIKEAIRRRVLWVFSIVLLVYLFGSWFLLDYKPENQIRNYVAVVYWAMTPLLLLTGGLLAAFSIPTDVRTQTIHTIVTKPVERFEIVLGRFFGFTLLMTAVLVVMTAVSLGYVLRGIDPDASFESKRARVPLYGDLQITPEAKNVGYEWDYRGFIAGGVNSPDRAIWSFRDVPRHLADRSDPVPCEFSFEVFRTTKGEENKGVFCTLSVQSWHWDPALASRYAQEREAERTKPNASREAVDEMLAEKYGFYEAPSKEVVDYHTLSIAVPTGIFKNALKDIDQRPQSTAAGHKGEKVPAMQIVVKCESNTQYVGMAKRDLYLLDAERSFEWNFFKGAVGLWLRLCLVIGLAVACSTYLSGVIAWLTTMFLFIAGFFEEFIRALADNKNVGGGPMESLARLVEKQNLIVPLDQTPANALALGSDEVYRWLLRRFLDIIPNVDQFDFTSYVAEGFDIAEGQQLVLSTLILLGYLLPWAILAYYLMKSREVAA